MAFTPFMRYSGSTPMMSRSTMLVLWNLITFSMCHHPKGNSRPRLHFCTALESESSVMPTPTSLWSGVFQSSTSVTMSMSMATKKRSRYCMICLSVSGANP